MTTASQSPVAPGRRVLAASPGGEVSGDEHPGLGVELEQLAGELFEHVVGDHVGGPVDQAEAAHLHAGHDHGGGLAGPDGVGEQERPAHDPGDRGALVVVGDEGGGQAREGEVLAGVGQGT